MTVAPHAIPGPVPAQIRRGLNHPDAFAPLYEQVRSELESIALNRSLTDTSSLPAEPKLMAEFGVSRGTLRRAIDELTREGLLVAEQGRGTYVSQEERVRRVVWSRLRAVALPDSRFDLELRHYVPDFAGRAKADARVLKQAAWSDASTVFVMPDNSLRSLRHKALLAGKRLLVPTFGFRRGVIVLDGGAIDDADKAIAATLDGMEQVGSPLTVRQARGLHVDLVLTGATAASRDGRVIGRGEPLLGIAWAAMEDLGLVGAAVRIIAVIHDCQLIASDVPAVPEIVVDLLATPSQLIHCEPGASPVGGRGAQVSIPAAELRGFLTGRRTRSTDTF